MKFSGTSVEACFSYQLIHVLSNEDNAFVSKIKKYGIRCLHLLLSGMSFGVFWGKKA